MGETDWFHLTGLGSGWPQTRETRDTPANMKKHPRYPRKLSELLLLQGKQIWKNIYILRILVRFWVFCLDKAFFFTIISMIFCRSNRFCLRINHSRSERAKRTSGASLWFRTSPYWGCQLTMFVSPFVRPLVPPPGSRELLNAV